MIWSEGTRYRAPRAARACGITGGSLIVNGRKTVVFMD